MIMSGSESFPRCVRSHSFRVAYADTDQMGVVYHSNYLRWFEIGRTDFLRALGQNYRQWEQDLGVFLPVRRASLEFMRPALYDQWIAVDAELARLTPASVEFHYRIIPVESQQNWSVGNWEAREILATGTTVHPFVDREGRIRRVGKELLPGYFA